MSNQGELPQWAASAGQPAGDYYDPGNKGSGKRWLTTLVALLALAATAAGGYLVAGYLDGDSTEATADPAGPTVAEEATDDVSNDESAVADDTEETDDTEEAGGTTDGETGTIEVETSTTTAAADSEPTEEDDATTADDEIEISEDRKAVFRQGTLYLEGRVPSQEVADAIFAKAAAVVGPENVEVNYDIDPNVAFDPTQSAPLYVEDVVLFQFNSVALDPPFLPILDLGVILLQQNPQASITVITRTDATGSESVNLEVATQRATAVLEYLVSKGVDPGQVGLDPRGEEGAAESDDEQTAATQRRAEFILTDVLT